MNGSESPGVRSPHAASLPSGHEDPLLLDLARRQSSARRTSSRVGVAAAVLVALVAAGVVATRADREASMTSTEAVGWTDILPTDAAAMRGAEPPVAISAVVEWDSRLLVVTADEGSGSTAWVSSDGNWERRTLAPPTGCDPHGGLVAMGELLTISCVSGEGGEVFVASTRDLETWREVTAEGAGFVDAAPQRVRSFGDQIVITGAVNEYPTGPDQAVVVRPALWVSEGGEPFRRALLPLGPEMLADSPRGAWSFDATQTLEGYAVVGGAADGSEPLAWTSSDLVTWTPSTIPVTTDAADRQSLWSVAMAPDGTLLASGVRADPGASATRSSADGGRTWQLVGEGPELLSVWNDHVVGARSGMPLRVLRWNPPSDAQASDVTEGALVLDVGAIDTLPVGSRRIVAVPSTDDHEALFVLRNDDDRLVALSARSPKQGCRLVDVDSGELDLDPRPEVQFHDPCHGSNFDRDGTLVGGPGLRGMYRYDVAERDDRILVNRAFAHPGAARTGVDLGELDGRPVGVIDAVASRWVAATTAAAAEVRPRSVS